MLAAEVPYIAGKTGVFPAWFAKENKNGSPRCRSGAPPAWCRSSSSSSTSQNSTYLALVNIATSAALVPYVFSGAYGLKLALKGETYAGQPHQRKRDPAAGPGGHRLMAAGWSMPPGWSTSCWWRCSTARGSSSTGRRASTTACAALNRLEQGMTAALLGCAVLAFYKVMDGTIPLH